jgi:DNA polymerase III delta subunit
MIYFIYGKDNFRSEQYLNTVIEFYKKGNPFYFSFDFADKFLGPLDISELKEILGSRNLFSDTKLIVLKNLLGNSLIDFRKEVMKLIASNNIHTSKSIMFLIYEDDDIRKDSVFKWLKNKAKFTKEYPLLKRASLNRWLEQEAHSLNLKLTKEAKDILIDSFGSETGLIYYALKKLSLVKTEEINKQILEDNVWLPFNPNIFQFLDDLAGRKTAAALHFLTREIDRDNSVFHLLYILKMIIFEFRNLLAIKESKAKSLAEAQKKTKIHPYTLSKIYPLSKTFSSDDLKRIYQRLFICDQRIKKGIFVPELALEMLLLDVNQILEK